MSWFGRAGTAVAAAGAAVATMIASPGIAHANTPTAPDAAMSAFNTAYWSASPTPQFYRWTNHTQHMDWPMGPDFEVVVDAYERTGLPAYRTQLDQIYTFLTSSAGWGPTSGWGDMYYDDAVWTLLPMLRAYQSTGDTKFLNPARDEWNYVYDHGHDDVLGGGIYWEAGEPLKSANTNGGMVISGYQLADITGDSTYATKAKGLADWMIGHLFVPSTGQVYNQQNLDGTVQRNDWSYNYGVFIGAMGQVYKHTGDATYLDRGIKAIEYVRNYDPARKNTAPGMYNLSKPSGVLSDESNDINSAEFKQDFIRYVSRFVADNGLTTYVPWLQLNANLAWNNRRTDGLMGQRSTTLIDPTIGGPLSTSGFDVPATTAILGNTASLPGLEAVLAAASDGMNVAPQAGVTASSSFNSQYAAANVADGKLGQHAAGEWASAGTPNPWVQLTWSTPQRLDKIVLFDRMNTADNANSGTLSFSDGTSIPVSGIEQGGFLRSITFAPRNVTSVRFQVTGGTGVNVGLSEFQAYSENDLAYGRATTSSSVYGAGFATGNAVDNDRSTRFSTAGTTTSEWFRVDLGSPQTINTVETEWEASYGKAYSIAVSTDGVNYTTVANRNGIIHAGVTDDRFAPVSARYVRITMTEGYRPAAQARNFSFWGLKVFNLP